MFTVVSVNMKIRERVIVAIVCLLISPCCCPKPPRKKMKCNKEFTYVPANGDNLKEEFIKRYNSWGTYFKNIGTFHWFDALKWLSVRRMRELCVCFHLKIHPNESEVELYENPEEKDSDFAYFSYTFLKMGSRNKRLRMYSCREYLNTVIHLLSGHSHYAFKKKYEVYVVCDGWPEETFIGVGKGIPLSLILIRNNVTCRTIVKIKILLRL